MISVSVVFSYLFFFLYTKILFVFDLKVENTKIFHVCMLNSFVLLCFRNKLTLICSWVEIVGSSRN